MALREWRVVSALGRVGRWGAVPPVLLLLQLGSVYVAGTLEHGFAPVHRPDTRSYLKLAEARGLEAALSSYRTVGYPLFLRLVGGEEEVDLRRAPHVQFGLYSLAVMLLWLGLRSYLGSSWWAFAGATPLPWAWVLDLAPEILTDFLAVAASLVVVAAVLFLAIRPASPPLWMALGLAVAATYQIRPAALFLILWAPLAAALLRGCREGRWTARLLGWAGGVALVTVVPYLLFALLRLSVVGHFGLVSFGGRNLAGVAACFLDDQVVRELPAEHRQVAASMLAQRKRRGWRPMTLDSDPWDAFVQFNDNFSKVAMRAVGAQLRWEKRQLAARGLEPADRRPGRVRRNEILARVSRAIIRLRPRLYLRWVRSGLAYGLRTTAGRRWVAGPFLLLIGSLPVLLIRTKWRRGRAVTPEDRGRLLGVSLTGVSFYLTYLLLLSVASWPTPRYLSGALVLLPGVLLMQLYTVWRGVLGRPAGPGAAETGSSPDRPVD